MAVQPNVIAIIDDDPGIRDALECLLLALGHRTESYASAEEFVSATTVTEASCLLVDIQLGEV
jgi:FixJ family two-component response regulator